jgi:UDP-N-acetylglucosamine--N-acetylmuramyl-(pentapeptide) pyrophosphoryl-undecaprenol N-acetylglucosamine transferase
MKIVIVGGHLAPALGLIDSLPREDTVVFIGRKFAIEGDKVLSLEFQEINSRNIPFLVLAGGRFQRSFSSQTLPSLSRIPLAVFQAVTYLRRVQPDVVLSFGGYLSVSVGIAAKMLRIPLVIHEQTLEAGLANKILAPFASKICISWENSRPFFPSTKVVLTGNPLKIFTKKVFDLPFSSSDQKLPLLYVTGGSTGSHAINMLVENGLDMLTRTFCVIHQTGDTTEFGDYERLVIKKAALPELQRARYHIQKYVTSDQIGEIMDKATIIMSRSGINTVTELIFFGKPALLIPLPHGQKGEQIKNAQFLQKLGLATVLPQENASSEAVHSLLTHMLTKRDEYKAVMKTAKATLHPNAPQEIIETLSYVVQKKNS